MKTIIRHMVLFFIVASGILTSCVTPNEIDILGENRWTVYGIMGEDNAPVIFIYKVTEALSFAYNTSAKIEVEHLESGIRTLLVPEIAGEDFNYSVNEFPFDEDWSGSLIYYTTPFGIALPGGDYRVSIDLGKETGTAEISLPESVEFSNVEIRETTNNNGNDVDRIYMSIDDIPGNDIYKWEVSIDQVIPVQIPLEYDSINGEPISFEETPILFSQKITPNNYITQKKIEDSENEFRYNLTANFPDFAYTDETYLINVRLRHYSYELVDYFESVADQNSGAIFDPFTEPVFIHSNIDGLPGVIGTYAYSQDYLLEFRP